MIPQNACFRCFSDGFKQNGIKKITVKGIVTADGVEHLTDLIAYSASYDATDGVISYTVVGRKGETLADVWKDHPRAYLATSVAGLLLLLSQNRLANGRVSRV